MYSGAQLSSTATKTGRKNGQQEPYGIQQGWMPSSEFWKKSHWQQYKLQTNGFGSSSAEKAPEALVYSKLYISQQCAMMAKEADGVLGCVNRTQPVAQGKWLSPFTELVPLYWAVIRPHLEYRIWFCHRGTRKTLPNWSEFSGGLTQYLGLEHFLCERQLVELDLFHLE